MNKEEIDALKDRIDARVDRAVLHGSDPRETYRKEIECPRRGLRGSLDYALLKIIGNSGS